VAHSAPPHFDPGSGRELWRRLESWDPDPPQSHLSFTAMLARDQHWPGAYASRVLREYRRYLFLAITAGHPVCPSEAVDQAWHQHLLDTRRYWLEFCPEVLGQPLHHTPSRSGPEEDRCHRLLYAQTLASYRRQFQEDPPGDIWPPLEQRFGGPPRPSLAKAAASRRLALRARAGFLSLPLLLLAAFPLGLKASGFNQPAALSLTAIEPLAMTGPDFLSFYSLLILGSVVAVLLLRRLLQAVPPLQSETGWQPNAVELAYLSGGGRQALTAAVLALVERGTVVLKLGRASHDPQGPAPRPGLETAVVDTLRRGGCSEIRPELLSRLERDHPLLSRLADRRGPSGYGVPDLLGRLERDQPVLKRLADDLQARGLVLSGRRKQVARWGQALLIAPVLLLGLVRLSRGMAAGRPVGMLILVLAGLVVGVVWIGMNPLHATWQGRRLVLRKQREHQVRNRCGESIEPAQTFALFGMAALPVLMAHQLVPPPPGSAKVSGGGEWGGGGWGGSWGGGGDGGGCGAGGGGGGGCGGGSGCGG
jgi:hypothetical protein